MRICLDGRRTDRGGIGRLTQQIGESLLGLAGVDATILVHHSSTREPDGVATLPCGFSTLSFEESVGLPQLLQGRGFDLFVSPQFYAPLGIRIPVVSWVHDTWPLRHPEWLPPLNEVFARYGDGAHRAGASVVEAYESLRARNALFPGNRFLTTFDSVSHDALERFVVAMFALNLQRCVGLIACSATTRQELIELFPEVASKTDLVYNPVPRFVVESPRDAAAAGNGRATILHVSKWERRKNVPILFDVMAILLGRGHDVGLHLVGSPVSRETAREISDRLAASGLASRVTISSDVTDDELATLYRSARAFVMPSFYEGFSIPLLEAFASDTPVAAADRGAIPEIAGDAAKYFDPSNSREIADALEPVLYDTATRAVLRGRGRQRIAELSAQPFAPALLKVFHRAVRKDSEP